MRRFFINLLWIAVFLLVLAGIDQLLVRIPATAPAHVAVTTFYRDLRGRVIDLCKGKQSAIPTPAKPTPLPKDHTKTPPASIEAIIDQRQAAPAPAPAKPVTRPPAAQEPAPRYVYADAQGELHFAETLAEVPEQFRNKAKRLGE